MSAAELLAEVAAAAGVTVAEVEQWREADWERHLDNMSAVVVAMEARADQAQAACAEAARCGCQIEVGIGDDGEPIIGTERVAHTCGRDR